MDSRSAIQLLRFNNGHTHRSSDQLVIEEPLQISLSYSFKQTRVSKDLTVTMRTPGHDLELTAGFLFTEGIVRHRHELADLRFLGPGESNEVMAELATDVDVVSERLNRNFYTTSSCGICGKASMEALEVGVYGEIPVSEPVVHAAMLATLPDQMRVVQETFSETGALHACGLFDGSGGLRLVREDVGRHNAVDKVIGAEFLAGRTPLSGSILVLSGRAGFELIQKAAVAGVPVVVAVGAPTSLAVETARRFGMTLAGFAREGRCNVYSGEQRVREDS